MIIADQIEVYVILSSDSIISFGNNKLQNPNSKH